MRRLFALFCIMSLMGSMAVAIELTDEDLHPSEDKIEQGKQLYNQQYYDQVPGAIKSVVGGERINANISGEDDSVVYGVELEKMKITTIQKGGFDDPTLKVWTDLDTIERVANSDNPRKAGVKAFNSDDVRYEAVGTVNSFKYGVASIILKIQGLF